MQDIVLNCSMLEDQWSFLPHPKNDIIKYYLLGIRKISDKYLAFKVKCAYNLKSYIAKYVQK
jgi:hypothetical protein